MVVMVAQILSNQFNRIVDRRNATDGHNRMWVNVRRRHMGQRGCDRQGGVQCIGLLTNSSVRDRRHIGVVVMRLRVREAIGGGPTRHSDERRGDVT